MNIIYCITFSFSLLLINTLPAMDTDPSQEQAVVQAITENNWSLLTVLDPSRTLINKVLITTKLLTGEIVKLSPLLHAVYTRNAHLVAKLLAHGAQPIGKLDTASQLTTPVQEAFKLGATQTIIELKNAWIALLQQQIKNASKLSEEIIEHNKDQFGKQDWYTKQPAPQNLGIDTAQSDKISFSNAAISNNIQELRRLVQCNPTLINRALIRTILASGETVDLAPLAYAVYTQNAPLVQTLLELGAIPVGKWDAATQLETPLQEARKSGNTVIKDMIRNNALAFIKTQLAELIESINVFTDPANKESLALTYQVFGFDDEKLSLGRQRVHQLYDIEKLLDLCTMDEADQYINLEDLVSTKNVISEKVETIQKAINEGMRRSLSPLHFDEHKNQ